MFSGIVEEMATVVAIKHDKENIDFTLRCSFVDELGIDQSVAHNGVCLTVVEIKDGTYTVTAMKETLERSNLGLLKVGDKVNVERSMVMNGRLDGHIVQGHVDETAKCIAMKDADGSTYFTFEYELHVAWATWSSTSVYGDNQWQWSLNSLHTTINEAAYSSLAILYLEDFLCVGYLVQSQLLSHLRTYLGCITIDSLATTDHRWLQSALA